MQVLAGQDLGWGHQHALPASLDRAQKRHQCHKRLPRTHIPLQQTVHALGAGHVGSNLSHGTGLGTRRGVGQGGQHAGLQVPIALTHAALLAPLLLSGQGQRDLMREELIIGQTFARLGCGGDVFEGGGRMGRRCRFGKIRPPRLRLLGGIDPFMKLWHTGQGTACGLEHQLLRDAAGERIDRLKRRNAVSFLFRDRKIRVDHLGHAIKKLHPA